MEIDIEEPLQYVTFKRLNIGQVEQVHEHVRRKASVKGELENMHLCPRATELRWNKAFADEALKEEEPIEPEQRQSRGYIPGEEVSPLT